MSYLRTVTQTNFRDLEGNPIMLNGKPLPNVSFNEDEECSWKGKEWWNSIVESLKGNSQEWYRFKNGNPWVEIDKDCEAEIEIAKDLPTVTGLMDVLYTLVCVPEVIEKTDICFEEWALTITISKNVKTGVTKIDMDSPVHNFVNKDYSAILTMVLGHYSQGIDVTSNVYKFGLLKGIRDLKINVYLNKEANKNSSESLFEDFINQIKDGNLIVCTPCSQLA